jgi:cytochrome c peroxidase
MPNTRRVIGALLVVWIAGVVTATSQSQIGQEISVPRHLRDGEEFTTPLRELLAFGQRLFAASWTIQEGGGRPLTKGTGNALTDPASPLVFPRNFNRISAPDSNSCAGCHNLPFGIAGGGGDIVANVFVLGQRFDFATFDGNDGVPTRGAIDEAGLPVVLQTIADSRATLGMFGSGYIEMLARQMTQDLQAIRDATPPGRARRLFSKGVSFGVIARQPDGRWVTSGVEGIPAPSLVTTGPTDPPSLIIRPFHQAANVISLRQFTNNAFNHHHGIQSTERFGIGTDPDGDGFVDEMSRADVTAVTLFQATMAVPGRVIPNDPEIEAAVLVGEARFASVGCAACHIPALPLDRQGWIFTEPNQFNPAGNLRLSDGVATVAVDLTRDDLPNPRLRPSGHVVYVPAYTDLKLHNITSGRGDPNIEALDMNQPAGSPAFFAGNPRFLTRKLWGFANEPPFFHHGMYTTIRQSVLAHAGEAQKARAGYERLTAYEQDCVIEFLKTLQVLRPGTQSLVVDERGRPKRWPPR